LSSVNYTIYTYTVNYTIYTVFSYFIDFQIFASELRTYIPEPRLMQRGYVAYNQQVEAQKKYIPVAAQAVATGLYFGAETRLKK